MERKLTNQSNSSSTKGQKKVTSSAAQEILSQLEADVQRQSDYSSKSGSQHGSQPKKSKVDESNYSEDEDADEDEEDFKIKSSDLIVSL